MQRINFIFMSLLILVACTKKVAKDPELAYGDLALLDSAKKAGYYYYKGKDTVWAGSGGPHGEFKLRFNSIAYLMLTDSGRIPKNKKFPDGSFIVKDVWRNNSVFLYAYMYKHKGKWLWGEVEPSGKFHFGQKDGEKSCLGCHSQSANRDNVVVFKYY